MEVLASTNACLAVVVKLLHSALSSCPFSEAIQCTVTMRVVLRIGCSILYMEENLWLTYDDEEDDARLTAGR
jgi:hypothetical protein